MNYLYKGTIIVADTKKEAIQKILSEVSYNFSKALKIVISHLSPYQKDKFKKCLKNALKNKVSQTTYTYITDNNGVQWLDTDLKYDDGEDGIIFSDRTSTFYYTFEAAQRVAKKLGARIPSKQDWINLALSTGANLTDNEDSGFKQKDNRNIVMDNIEGVKEFLHLNEYPGFALNSGKLMKEGNYAQYWTDVSIGGGALSTIISHKFMVTNVVDKYKYLTIRLVK